MPEQDELILFESHQMFLQEEKKREAELPVEELESLLNRYNDRATRKEIESSLEKLQEFFRKLQDVEQMMSKNESEEQREDQEKVDEMISQANKIMRGMARLIQVEIRKRGIKPEENVKKEEKKEEESKREVKEDA